MKNCKRAYKKQSNIWVSIVKKAKKGHFQNINLPDISENKKFWTTATICQQSKKGHEIQLVAKMIKFN